MNARKILVPTDFSECSEAPLEQATSLALDTGAKLIILHVVADDAQYEDHGFGGYPVIDNETQIEHELEKIMPKDPRLACEYRLLRGAPESMIVSLAETERVDFIVMGTHGRTGMMRWLMGSVAEYVIRHASCPVLTVKQRRHGAEVTNPRALFSRGADYERATIPQTAANLVRND